MIRLKGVTQLIEKVILFPHLKIQAYLITFRTIPEKHLMTIRKCPFNELVGIVGIAFIYHSCGNYITFWESYITSETITLMIFVL